MASSFHERVRRLRRLGLGISTEFGAGREGLDVVALRQARPDLVSFLEVGADVDRGVDRDVRAWVARGWPTTYHFLDLNLEEGDDLDWDHVAAIAELARSVGAAWLCGDAGLWHVGRRDRGHGVLMPPVLCAASAAEMGRTVRRIRERTGFEVLPENPPAHVFLGDLHLLDYFARVADAADSGLLLDVAHLAVYQRVTGHRPTVGIDRFPCDRIVELHVAGGTPFESGGRTFVDDDHGVAILPDVWEILEAVLPLAVNLRAVVFECERNPPPAVIPLFERLKSAAFPLGVP